VAGAFFVQAVVNTQPYETDCLSSQTLGTLEIPAAGPGTYNVAVSLLDSVRSGAVDGKQLRAVVRLIGSAVGSAHAAGLAHGSVVAGNVLVQPALGTVLLLDFGMTAVLNPSADNASLMRADRLGLAALTRTIRRLRADIRTGAHARL